MARMDVGAKGTSFIVLFCTILPLASSCFITNCPPGGKRSANSPRECLRCGPGYLGHCFGPDICCGELIGCFIRTQESKTCSEENTIPILCAPKGVPCITGRGRCAADGICCNEESCNFDKTCTVSATRLPDKMKMKAAEFSNYFKNFPDETADRFAIYRR